MLRIELTENNFQINGISFKFPIAVDSLINILGECKKHKAKYNTIFTWDDLGILAYSKNESFVESLCALYKPNEYIFSPKNVFSGQLKVNNDDALSYFNNNKNKRIKLFKDGDKDAIVINEIQAYFDFFEDKLKLIELSGYEKPVKSEVPTPLHVDDKYKSLEAHIKQWLAEIGKIVDKDNKYYNLAHGITNSDIKTYLQLDENIDIPDELVNFYKIVNVEYNAVTSAICFFVKDWQYDLIPFKDIAEEWQQIQGLQFGDDIEAENLAEYSEKIQATDYANSNWVPFATGRNGDYLLYDTKPSNKGRFGQIIELQNESWQRNIVAQSLQDLIQNQVDMLKNGQTKMYDFIIEENDD